jgi:hypothetical protein
MAKQKGKNNTTMVIAFVIIVAVVASILFFLYKPNQVPIAVSSCMGQTNSACSSSAYNHANGNLTVTIAQDSGSNWSIATIIFVPQGTPYSNGVPSVSWTGGTTLNNGLQNGVSDTVELPASGPVQIGTKVDGTIWAQYQTNVGGTMYYAELAAVNATAG